ncbi:MAG: Ppx/GppA phosphatase family protein, partial [Streptosporangiaceae bacterium]
MPGGNARRVAAIDCGTNSLRLLVADVDPDVGQLTDLHRSMEIVRLGQGVDATGRLAPEALDRTFAVLRRYAETIDELGAEAVRMVATSATRDASNAAEFAAGVRATLRITPEVVTGSEEARLSFAGATAELGPAPAAAGQNAGPERNAAEVRPGEPAPAARPEPPFLVVDIGGGSTEFVLGSPGAAPGAGLAVMS